MAAPDAIRPEAPGAASAMSERARRILECSGLGASASRAAAPRASERAFVRAESEDDDGYDPYSDRPAAREEAFQADPWS